MIKWLQRLALLLPWIGRRRECALDEELASYLEMAENDARGTGLSPEEARRAARQNLGNLTLTRESVRSEWVPPRVEQFEQDIGYLVRSLRRDPMFACIAVCSLTFGIGAANTVFSLVDGILLKPLAYEQHRTSHRIWGPPGKHCGSFASRLPLFQKAMIWVSKPRPVGTPLQEVISGSVHGSLWVLFAAVLILLLIVCVNLANLMLAPTHRRAREFLIRTALGADRRRLMQQVLTEALFIALLGGLFGIALAGSLLQVLKLNTAFDLPRIGEVHIDARLVLFSLALTVLCACVSGLPPPTEQLSPICNGPCAPVALP